MLIAEFDGGNYTGEQKLGRGGEPDCRIATSYGRRVPTAAIAK